MHELRITKEDFKALQRKLKNFEIVRHEKKINADDLFKTVGLSIRR